MTLASIIRLSYKKTARYVSLAWIPPTFAAANTTASGRSASKSLYGGLVAYIEFRGSLPDISWRECGWVFRDLTVWSFLIGVGARSRIDAGPRSAGAPDAGDGPLNELAAWVQAWLASYQGLLAPAVLVYTFGLILVAGALAILFYQFYETWGLGLLRHAWFNFDLAVGVCVDRCGSGHLGDLDTVRHGSSDVGDDGWLRRIVWGQVRFRVDVGGLGDGLAFFGSGVVFGREAGSPRAWWGGGSRS